MDIDSWYRITKDEGALIVTFFFVCYFGYQYLSIQIRKLNDKITNREHLLDHSYFRYMNNWIDIHIPHLNVSDWKCLETVLRDFLDILNPKHVIPAHADPPKIEAMMNLLDEEGYKRDRNAHLMLDGGVLEL